MGCSIFKGGLKAGPESSRLKVRSDHSSKQRANSLQRCTRDNYEHEMGEIDAQEKYDLRSLMRRDSIFDEHWESCLNPDLPSLKALMEESNANEHFEQKLRNRVEQNTCKMTTNDVADSQIFEERSRDSKECCSTIPVPGNVRSQESTNDKKHVFLKHIYCTFCKLRKQNWFLSGMHLPKAGIHGNGNVKEKHLDRRESLQKDCFLTDKMNRDAKDCMPTIVQGEEIHRGGRLTNSLHGDSLKRPEQVRINRGFSSPSRLHDDIERMNCGASLDEESSFPEKLEDSSSIIFDRCPLYISDAIVQQAPLDKPSYQLKISDTTNSCPPRCCLWEIKNELLMLRFLMAETEQGERLTAEAFLKHLRQIKQTMNTKKIASSKFSALELEEIELKLKALQRFEFKCPPGGDERVVLYTTTLRGIRKTYDDCNNLRMLLQGFFVQVDERDVSMHLAFKQEIQDLLGQPLHVPKLFINGRYIGGAGEAFRLNEEGTLARLLENFPRISTKPCDGCGGVRFAPCTECNGSCKIMNQNNEPIKCKNCNENGLVRCPICS